MPEETPVQQQMSSAQFTSVRQPLLPNRSLDSVTSSWWGQIDKYCRASDHWKIWLGKAGESLAAAVLEEKGWSIEARNWRAGRYAEIDIVALEPSGLRVFVEVKTRRRNAMASSSDLTGFEAINKIRQQKIVTSARIYLARSGISNSACRFDVIAIQWRISPNDPLVKPVSMPEFVHVENAFTS